MNPCYPATQARRYRATDAGGLSCRKQAFDCGGLGPVHATYPSTQCVIKLMLSTQQAGEVDHGLKSVPDTKCVDTFDCAGLLHAWAAASVQRCNAHSFQTVSADCLNDLMAGKHFGSRPAQASHQADSLPDSAGVVD